MRKIETMYAEIKCTTIDGEEVTEQCDFKLLPPESDSYYGTGYYMLVKMSLSGKQLIDVRYAKTTDIEILADQFIHSWYGKRINEITMKFPTRN